MVCCLDSFSVQIVFFMGSLGCSKALFSRWAFVPAKLSGVSEGISGTLMYVFGILWPPSLSATR